MKADIGNEELPGQPRGMLCVLVGDFECARRLWLSMDPNDRRVFYQNRLYAEFHFGSQVVANPDYQRLLDELGMGPKWRAYLQDKVAELEPITGIGMRGVNDPQRAIAAGLPVPPALASGSLRSSTR